MAINSNQVSVGHTTAVAIIAAGTISTNYSEGEKEPNRWVSVSNPSGATVYLGASTVTANTGYLLLASATLSLWMHPDEALYGLAASGTQVVSYIASGS